MSRATSELPCHLVVANTSAIGRKDMGISVRHQAGSVYISLADTHGWAQVFCVLSALYVGNDVAASFSFQYTARFKILRL